MKKLLFFTVIAVLGFNTANAQDDTNTTASSVMEMAKGGGFYAGANIGISLLNDNYYYSDSNNEDYGSFNFGFDVAYLFEVIDNLEVGGLLGYTQFVASGKYASGTNNGNIVFVNFKDASFIPITASARYYFADHKFFGGIDLGVAVNVSGDAKTGFYARPKFGFDLGKIALIASFQSISGGQNYNSGNINTYSLNGFKSVNFGAEFGF
jgi:hypothetical protein